MATPTGWLPPPRTPPEPALRTAWGVRSQGWHPTVSHPTCSGRAPNPNPRRLMQRRPVQSMPPVASLLAVAQPTKQSRQPRQADPPPPELRIRHTPVVRLARGSGPPRSLLPLGGPVQKSRSAADPGEPFEPEHQRKWHHGGGGPDPACASLSTSHLGGGGSACPPVRQEAHFGERLRSGPSNARASRADAREPMAASRRTSAAVHAPACRTLVLAVQAAALPGPFAAPAGALPGSCQAPASAPLVPSCRYTGVMLVPPVLPRCGSGVTLPRSKSKGNK